MTNRINSSSAHITADNLDWLRKTDGDNIMWIPMFADYYLVYKALEKRWWFRDDNGGFKIPNVPDIESIYQEMKKP